MSELIQLDSDEWTKSDNVIGTQLLGRIQFATSPIVFDVQGEYIDGGDRSCYELTVEPEILVNQISYIIEYQVRLLYRGVYFTEEIGVFDGTAATSKELFVDAVLTRDHTVTVKLSFKKMDFAQLFHGLNADLKAYIERGPTVTLVGSDGSVSVPERLLKMRSEALEGMVKSDLQEERSGQIKMEDFDTKTLTAFKQFLMTGRITDDEQTARGLILLANKYDVPTLREAAEVHVKQNIKEMDKGDIFS